MVEVKAPILAESIVEAAILKWHKQAGEWVQAEDTLAEIETDKVILDVVAPASGQLLKIHKHAGELIESGEALADIDADAMPVVIPHIGSLAEESNVVPTPVKTSTAKTSPAARHLAAETGIDSHQVPHTGDRVTKADVLKYQAQQNQGEDKPKPKIPEPVIDNNPSPITPATPEENSARPQQRVPMTRLRKSAASRLLAAQQQHAILTTFNEVNMQAVMDLRQQYKADFEKTHDSKLGFMSFFVKAVTHALKKYPLINASIDGDDIIYHGFYDIGIAVSSERGLVVPIVRDVDRLSFAEIENQIRAYADKARHNKLELEDLQGGTFTITNGGVFGSMLSTPILNPPQSAILGMHNIVERPIAENGQVVIRPIMYVALSYDHQIIDGREAVQFLRQIKQSLEDPRRLLLDL